MAAFGISKKGLQRKAHCISVDDVRSAEEYIRPLGIGITPVMTSSTMNVLSGHNLYFKCELFQKTGSFKARGASNACSRLPVDVPVVTHSSGNHAQAIAFAAKTTKRSATVIMPTNAPTAKREATEGYGASVRLCEPANRAADASRAAEELGAELIHPSENPHVIAGQGTVALELLKQLGDMFPSEAPLDAIIIPVGGGGLLAGCAVYCKATWPNMMVVGAEPLSMNDASRSFKLGEIQTNPPGATTVADGLRTQLGPNTWPVIRDLADDILTVQEEDIVSATALVWSRMKLQIEPSAGVAVAVALSQPFREMIEARQLGREARVGVVLCGGNIDVKVLGPLLADARPYPRGSLSENKA